MLKIHEITAEGGRLVDVCLAWSGESLALVTGDEVAVVPEGAVEAVMARFGAPFDETEAVTVVATLAVGAATLRHVRHLARYDVIARDYVVYVSPGGEATCALATTVAGALAHVARTVAG